MDDTEQHETIAKVTDRLAARYPETSRNLIAGAVTEEYELLDSGRIRAYIPTLVERGAKNRLREGASALPAATWRGHLGTVRKTVGTASPSPLRHGSTEGLAVPCSLGVVSWPWRGAGRTDGSGPALTVTGCWRCVSLRPVWDGFWLARFVAVVGAVVPDQTGSGDLADEGYGRSYRGYCRECRRGCPCVAGGIQQPETVVPVG
jgi:hypothetical protein